MSKVAVLIPEVPLHPNNPHRNRRLGRHISPIDKKAQQKRRIVFKAAPLVSKMWDREIPPLNQGSIGFCTCAGCVGCLATTPYDQDGIADNVVFDETLALKIYGLATSIDTIPGTYPPDDTGSTVMAAMEAAKRLGLIADYKWCMGLDDVLQTLSTYGPVELGTAWYDGFYEPDANGQIHISGNIVGGHAYEAIGIDVEKRLVWCVNSWGSGWGVEGRFSISWDDLGKLLLEAGEGVHIVASGSPLVQSEGFFAKIGTCLKSLFKRA